jgi:hypothetical protein
MGTNLQPPRPPAPPQPPSNRRNYVVIALLVLALIVVAGGIGVWVGLHVLSNAVRVNVEQDAGKKGVSIKTPLGSLEVNHELDEADLGLPIYPGATRLTDHGSANVNINIGDEAKVRVVAGKFETPDSLEKVQAFYHDRLGNQVTNFKAKDEEGKTVFEIKHGKLNRVVALKSSGDRTVIDLVRVSEGDAEAN